MIRYRRSKAQVSMKQGETLSQPKNQHLSKTKMAPGKVMSLQRRHFHVGSEFASVNVNIGIDSRFFNFLG